jgi:hypothetical protein
MSVNRCTGKQEGNNIYCISLRSYVRVRAETSGEKYANNTRGKLKDKKID